MTSQKWYEVPIDQEQNTIIKKRKEWFPKAEEKDWQTLKAIYELVDFKKRNYRPLLKDIVHLFNPSTSKEVKSFCDKFTSRIISFSQDMSYVQISDITYKILTAETFNDLRETKYWLPHLEQILIQNQTSTDHSKNDFPEHTLFKILVGIESEKIFSEQRKTTGTTQVTTIRQPKIESFINSGIAYYHSISCLLYTSP